jgi:CrcB protein
MATLWWLGTHLPLFSLPEVAPVVFEVPMSAHTTLTPKQFALALLCVAGGGGVGTIARDLLLKLEPQSLGPDWVARIPWVLLAINVVGVYAATRLLLGPLRHHDPNNLTRLLLITGLLGGFTSYSSLFVDLATIWHVSVLGSIFMALMAVASGVFAGWLGLRRRRAR